MTGGSAGGGGGGLQHMILHLCPYNYSIKALPTLFLLPLNNCNVTFDKNKSLSFYLIIFPVVRSTQYSQPD